MTAVTSGRACPRCGEKVVDPRYVFCSSCGGKLPSLSIGSGRIRDEVEWGVYVFCFWLLLYWLLGADTSALGLFIEGAFLPVPLYMYWALGILVIGSCLTALVIVRLRGMYLYDNEMQQKAKTSVIALILVWTLLMVLPVTGKVTSDIQNARPVPAQGSAPPTTMGRPLGSF